MKIKLRACFLMFCGLVLSVPFIFGGCNKDKPEEKKLTLKIALPSEPHSLDPAIAYDALSLQMLSNVYETLFQYAYLSSAHELVPLLAADLPTVSGDKKTITIRIQKGIFFQNSPAFVNHFGKGRELKAQDFVYAFKRMAIPEFKSPAWWILDKKIEGFNAFKERLERATKKERTKIFNEGISGIQALDDTTLQFKLTAAFPQFMYLLAMPLSAPVAQEAVDFYGDEFGRIDFHPVGTGPFILAEQNPGKTVLFKRNERFHSEFFPTDPQTKHEDSGKVLPFLDEIHVSFIQNPADLEKKFQERTLDLIPLSHAPTDTEASPDASFEYLMVNMDDLVVGRNKQLRQALSSAIDREAYLKLLNFPSSFKQTSVLPPQIFGRAANSTLKWDFDGDRSKKLLDQSGHPEGKGVAALVLLVSGTDELSRAKAEFFSKAFEKIGIKLQAELSPFPQYLEKLKAKKFQIALASWTMDYPDAENIFSLLYGPNHAPGPNFSSFDSAEFNRQFEKVSLLPRTLTQESGIQKLEQIVQEECPWILLAYGKQSYGIQPWVKNFRASQFIVNRYKYLKK